MLHWTQRTALFRKRSLRYTVPKILKYVPRNETERPRSQFLHCASVSNLCIPWSILGRPILGIYKSLKDTWMWNRETEHYNYILEITRLHNFISGNTFWEPDIYTGFSPTDPSSSEKVKKRPSGVSIRAKHSFNSDSRINVFWFLWKNAKLVKISS